MAEPDGVDPDPTVKKKPDFNLDPDLQPSGVNCEVEDKVGLVR